MNNVFVWTASDIVGAVACGVTLALLIGVGCMLLWIRWLERR